MAYLLHKISDAYQLETRLSLVTQQSKLQLRAYKDLAEKYKGMMNAELDKLTPEFMCDNDFLLISVKNSFN